jgi:hypothetical protein
MARDERLDLAPSYVAASLWRRHGPFRARASIREAGADQKGSAEDRP